MADGLNRCLNDYPEWPPGAAQFRALCLGLNPRNIDPEGNEATWQLASPSHMAFDDPRRPENDPNHPAYVPKQLVLPGDGAKERNRAANRKSKSLIDAMFGSTADPGAGAEDAA